MLAVGPQAAVEKELEDVRSKSKRRLRWVGGALALAGFVGLIALERRRPLRRRVESPNRHDARNLAMAAIAGVSIALVQTPLVVPVVRFVERRRVGLLKLVPMPAALETLLAIALLDYTLYLWHYLTHTNAFLWRFHEAHHIDLDVSTTTGIRFHFGELLLSMPFRAAQVIVIGVSPRAFSIWQNLTTAQILFHHSNVRLPIGMERWLSMLIVTPRMHGIHHSKVRRETDSNWSTIFSVFDRLHGTLRLDVPQDELSTGVPAYEHAAEVTLSRSLTLPFRRVLHVWTKPGQPAPVRKPSRIAATTLVP
jgi:sterol desaturase/sphingolipid hydroxylase (fatty acid hydroxylase superfamily)